MVSMLSIAYVGFSVIAGIFLGRFGIKPSFLFGFSALCVGLFSMFFAPGFFLTAVALFVVFAGFGFFEVGLNALATRLFITKAALLMNLLHSFYGIGAMIGPKTAGLIAGNARFGWRYVYLFSLPLALAFFIPAIFIRFPDSTVEASPLQVPRKSFFDALKSPMVWLMSITLGLSVVVEMSTSNWGVMYFRDVYKINPNTDGASFLSAFFLLFTVSRLVCGLFVEKIGYMRTLLLSASIVLAVFIAGFLLGEKGIYLLPSLGFFVAQFWPTLMAVAIVSFGRDAPVFSSAMIAISGLIGAGIQFVVGLTNKIFGPAWGYRSAVIYTLLLIVALGMLYRKLKTKDRGSYARNSG